MWHTAILGSTENHDFIVRFRDLCLRIQINRFLGRVLKNQAQNDEKRREDDHDDKVLGFSSICRLPESEKREILLSEAMRAESRN